MQLSNVIDDVSNKLKAAVVGGAEGQYPQFAKDDLDLAIKAAKAILENETATDKQFYDAIVELNKNLDIFISKVVHVDTTKLSEAIENANKILNEAVIGEGNGQYSQETKDTLQEAIKVAQTILDNKNVTQVNVNEAVSILNEAIVTFSNKVFKVDRSVLNKTIENAIKILNEAVVGEGDGQYPQVAKDELQAAINESKAIFSDTNATQTKIDKTVSKLNSAIDEFNSKAVKVDRSKLSKAIEKARKLLDKVVVGNGKNQYPQEAVDELQKAINVAQDVLDNKKTTQENVDEATQKLNEAIEIFKSECIKITDLPNTGGVNSSGLIILAITIICIGSVFFAKRKGVKKVEY